MRLVAVYMETMTAVMIQRGRKQQPSSFPSFYILCIPTSEQEEDESHDHGVSKVQDGASQSSDLQLGEEVMNGIDQEIHSSEAAGQEGTPLPMIVL